MSDDEGLGNLAFSIDETRKDYRRRRDHLRLLMQEARGPVEEADTLTLMAQELGPSM